MKNVITNTKKGFLIVAMFASLLSFANASSFFIIKNDAEKTSIYLENVKKGNLLSIKDNNGVVLYEEKMEQNGNYYKGFNLSLLPNGSYAFELDKGLEIKTMPFKIEYNDVVFYKNLESTFFKPVLYRRGDLVFISKPAISNDGEPLNIKVYHEEADTSLLYKETITDSEKKTGVIFKLSDLENGTYRIVLESKGREFTNYIGI